MLERVGPYMHTSNGQPYYPFDPRPEEVDINVIAHHLANKCRYAGAVQHPHDPNLMFFSVAEHSVLVSEDIEEEGGTLEEQIEGLLHDGAEAFNGDLIRPLKHSPEFAEPFKKVELLNESAVSRRFNLPLVMSPIVKRADNRVCLRELQTFIPGYDGNARLEGEVYEAAPVTIQMLLPPAAKRFFLERFYQLMARRAASCESIMTHENDQAAE